MRTTMMVCGLIVALGTSAAAQQQPDRNYPPSLPGARAETYQKAGDTELRLFVFEPADHKPSSPRPAIVFFFGGGFTSGSPSQFLEHCRYFASRGMVAITADYRVKNRHKTSPADSVEDGRAAMRFVRANAERLGVDPQRIVASGGSAGGLIAACVGVIPDTDQPAAGSGTPNAMVLFNPAIMGKDAIERKEPDGTPSFTKEIMPFYHIHDSLPPSIMFFGDQDRLLAGAREFQKAAQDAGARCELRTWSGVGHGFFNFGRNDNREFAATLAAADRFLASLGYVENEPTVEAFMKQERGSGRDRQRPAAQNRDATDRQNANRRARERELDAFLAELDRNASGALEASELTGALGRYLAELDADQNGEISKAELRKMRGRPSRSGEIITGAAPGERYDDTLEAGDRAPDFSLPDPEGKRRVTLSSFQGKRPVVLIFGSYT